MKGYESDFDLSYIEASIATLFTCATTYDQAKLKFHEIGDHSAQEFQKAKAHLCSLCVKEKECFTKIQPIEKELADMEKWKSELTSDLRKHKPSLQVIRDDIQEFKEKIRNTPLIADQEQHAV